MAIDFSEAAASHIKSAINKRGHGLGLRLKIKVSGCSGYAYDLDYADEVCEGDQVFEAFDAKVIVDGKTLLLIDGTRIDYQAKGLNWNFVFDNPNAESLCGCGESFVLTQEPPMDAKN